MRRRGVGSRSMSVKSKWTKTKWLWSDRVLRRYVPDTMRFTRSSLKEMTGRYKTVYFKPTGGTGGNGIARVKRLTSRKFQVKKDVSSFEVSSSALFGRLKRIARGRSYLLQKGIALETSGGRPFDLRMMMQKTKAGKWVPSLLFVKLGKPNKVVTNYHQGGKLAYVEQTLRRTGCSAPQIERYKKRLKKLGMQTARCFDRRSKKFKELGLDIALDRKGRLWILEVNTRPSFSALKSLADKNYYRTIVRYGKQYGRTR
ncbi:YheC/YheD family protein [Paenibacillus rhizovicinus]|uniref:YheC/YheD family protein n=1 Tax=Paenibacillus rhizovicinus TaxID=2704463 RepID=A0A6C0P1H5_9BACL|nr:YheC/YheD family protein [Paenibacillus rhizovicinus]QHW32086.1 YheC/YheD family protein [Paenibacillus rhizovicinus]